MEGINSVIVNSGYSMIIFFSDNSIEREKEIISHCLSWVVEGVLISVSENTFDCDHFKERWYPCGHVGQSYFFP